MRGAIVAGCLASDVRRPEQVLDELTPRPELIVDDLSELSAIIAADKKTS